jgi:leucyl-tRNA synthetase
VSTSSAAIGMHHDCVRRYIELQAQMIAVITPHWADYIWQEVLKKVFSVFDAPNPRSKRLTLSFSHQQSKQ